MTNDQQNSGEFSTEDHRWLISDAATKWLDLAATASEESTLKVAQRLRKELTAERVHLVFEQVALRRRAVEKFSLAAQLFFTSKGLVQATDEWIAAYKAERFAPETRARSESEGRLADLCCGIGGDLLAIGCRGPVTGVDRDPVAALFAEANVAAWRAAGRAVQDIEVQAGDVATLDLREVTAWHLDPDRRPEGRRTTRVALHEPGPEVVERLLAACPHGAIKLAPAAALPDVWTSRAELEWISRDGECRQLVAWFGDLAQKPNRRSATVLSGSTTKHAPRIVSGEPGVNAPHASRVGRYVFEPDAAVLAANLTGALTTEYGLSQLTPAVAYLTGDAIINDAALACFEVLDLLPLRAKMLNDWLGARRVGRLEIKKRGVDLDPVQLRRQLRFAGDNAATLLVTRIDGRRVVIATRRVGV
jgi:THUMP domain-like